MGRKERFQKRKKLQAKFKNTIIEDKVDDKLVQEFLASEVDKQSVNEVFARNEEIYNFKVDLAVSNTEAKAFLEQFRHEFNQAKFQQLVSDCKKDIINSIVTPFGLGKIVAAYDKAGGNVDTIHNVRDGVYATQKAKDAYDNRGEYNTHEYHQHNKYIEVNRKNSELKKQGKLDDYMTGKKIDPHGKSDLDHVVSAKEIHDDAGRILAGIDGTDLANRETNLKATSRTNNRSKKADTIDEFLKRKDKNLKKLDVLKSKKNLSLQEQNELRKLEELSQIDNEKAKQVDKKARDAYENEVSKTYYTSKEFAQDTIKTGVSEGAKMGLQQAMGLVIVEFFGALFDEILDIYHHGFSNGFDNDKFFNILKERLKRIAQKLQEKWKDVAIAFKDGALSGFISNLVTTMINMFVTTAKRVVRIIREGLFSLFRAVKLLLFPPEGMTYEEAMHEAKKLLATGIIISLGVLAEEYIDKIVRTTVVLEPFADTLTAVFVGAITGLTVTMVVYYIDKRKNDKEMVKALISDTNQKFEKLDILFGELELIKV